MPELTPWTQFDGENVEALHLAADAVRAELGRCLEAAQRRHAALPFDLQATLSESERESLRACVRTYGDHERRAGALPEQALIRMKQIVRAFGDSYPGLELVAPLMVSWLLEAYYEPPKS